jgi:hypothetical protein
MSTRRPASRGLAMRHTRRFGAAPLVAAVALMPISPGVRAEAETPDLELKFVQLQHPAAGDLHRSGQPVRSLPN